MGQTMRSSEKAPCSPEAKFCIVVEMLRSYMPFGGSHTCASGPAVPARAPPFRPPLPTRTSPAPAGRRAPGPSLEAPRTTGFP